MKALLIALLMSPIAAASVLDTAPPEDAQGNWKVDLYDSAGLQRGTLANPLMVNSNPSPDVAFAAQNITTRDLVSTTVAQAGNQQSVSGTPTAGSAATFTLGSDQGAMVIITGTWTGTLTIEVSSDGGLSYQPRSIHAVGTALFLNNVTQNVVGSMNATAKTHLRVRATAAMTGTAVVKAVSSNNLSNLYVAAPIKIADGTATTTPPMLAVKAASVPADVTDAGTVVTPRPFLYKFVSGNQTVQIKAGSGVLHLVVIGNAATGGAITIYDNTAASGTVIGVFAAGTPSGGLLSGSGNPAAASVGPIDLEFNTGLTVVSSGSTSNSFTVVYQ